MLRIERSAERIQVHLSELNMVFERVGDRWRHSLQFLDQEHNSLHSVEGTPDDPVPVSPVFQDLWFEQRDDAACEFQLMGQAGQAIFSAAIRLDDATQSVDFEICARRKKLGANVGTTSTYQCGPVLPTRRETNAPTQAWRIESVPILGLPANQNQTEIHIEETRIAAGHFADKGCDQAEASQQVRWRYRIRPASQA